jgi:hypothetical protein
VTKRPPKSLKPRGPGRIFWKEIHGQFEIRDAHHLRLLQEACGCLDTITQAQREIEASGAFYVDRFKQPRAHPAFDLIKANRTLFARLIREMQLDTQPAEEARPVRLYG